MKNKINQTVPGLIYQAQVALPGVVANAETIGLAHLVPNEFTTHITDLIMARDNHATAKVDAAGSRVTLAAMMASGRDFGTTARDALKPYLGKEPSETWNSL